MNDILMLHSGSHFVDARMNDLCYKNDLAFLDVYELPDADLEPYVGMVIPGLIDQEFLTKEKECIRRFLDSGKVLVFSGHLFRPWLPGGSNFVPKTIRSHRDYHVSIHRPHPIFEGVLPEDMTYKQGVAGFFARGHHPVPEGAEVLLTLPGGEPIVYIDRNSTRGTILVHSGNDLLGYHSNDNTSGRIGPQLLRWIRDEHRQLQEKGVAI
ncbi:MULTISPECIES: hypothetical protein [Paenibacillus]|uniref:Uncharacterized protein n=1 Tax=Paenibacillus naphthalenovorans TaxID=162209 RepID=A0A0U2L4Q5_9BACL|nr:MULTISPECIES: hypothetical protein [Paenibacillus]ALS24978.1 hypothetical protein IJ22_47160 [Paenibacillus naphthalenovorans]NTZ19150.1 phosphate starvation-inducible protein PhoH [Paenibacillus sp. JMULE4]GCL74092.1 hypothetical protein PN4B1_40340 [Paenibacillus naphthalenovorans]SDJ34318.1 hypothetical protein SAMN05421868_12428 [Paenibacillus naphthalenovorans]